MAIASWRGETHWDGVKKDGLDERTESRSGWTGVESYLVALARRRTARHRREGRPHSRMDGAGPTPTIGTVPFLIMMASFALLIIAIATLAWPVHEQPRPRKADPQLGTAAPGWMEEAEKEMDGQK
ncbi:MAG TPA: hypothetical protein VM757_02035 [Sphingomicrobium sp.]|nr:hypothetical protein [Sphingomicrobium sp.]